MMESKAFFFCCPLVSFQLQLCLLYPNFFYIIISFYFIRDHHHHHHHLFFFSQFTKCSKFTFISYSFLIKAFYRVSSSLTKEKQIDGEKEGNSGKKNFMHEQLKKKLIFFYVIDWNGRRRTFACFSYFEDL